MSESKLLLGLLIKTIESQVSQIMVKSYDEGRSEGIQIGITTERERIIKLLDKALVYDEPVVIERDRLIALIKGENK